MSADEELRFSLRADVPKENMQVLDNVLNELFGSLSSKMKQAGEFLETVKMRPPQNSLSSEESEKEEEEETDSEMPDLVTESDESEEEESETESDVDADDESEIDHIFLILIDGKTVGYSPTLRGAMQAADEVYGEFTATHQGSFRLERTPTSLRVYRKTPYVWFMFSEQLALQVDIQVVARV